MATFVVTGDQYRTINQRMREIKRQLDQDGGSPFNPESVADALQRIVEGKFETEDRYGLISDWQNFYQEVFGITVDFSDLRIPKKQKGFDRLIIVAQEMTPQKLYDKCKELFPCSKWTDKNLDEIVTSDRTAKDSPYAIWLRDRVEADEELKRKSANKLKEEKISGITLEERLLYEPKYFKETGKHLDIENITLCTGSRDSDGYVPRVHWSGDKLEVCWCLPGGSHDHLRSRQAVS